MQLMPSGEAEEEVDKIMEAADVDKNGKLDYSEFIAATADKKNLMSKQRLKAAFQMFDKVFILHSLNNFQNENGSISPLELKNILDKGKKLDDKVWEQMIREVDLNGDGEISYKEFEQIMESLFKS